METAVGSKRNPFTLFLWVALALSSVVVFEPAPYDLFILALFFIGIIMSKLKFQADLIIGFVLLFLFILSNLFSMFEMINISRGAMYFAITVYLIISWFFFVGIIRFYGVGIFKAIFSGYTFAALSSAVIGILAFFQMIPYADQFIKFGRATGLFKDPNVFGPFLVPISLYAFLQITKSFKMIRFFWILTFILTTSGVLLSFSRAAWGNYTIALFTFLFLWGIRISKGKIMIQKKLIGMGLLLLLLLGILSIIVLNTESVLSFLNQRFALQHYDTDRFSTQETAFANSLKHPFGVGPGQSELIYNYATHSLYVRILTENGFLGFLSFIGFVLVTFYRAIKLYYSTNNPIYALIFSSLLGLMLNSITIDSLHWRHFWLLLAIPWTTVIYSQKRKHLE